MFEFEIKFKFKWETPYQKILDEIQDELMKGLKKDYGVDLFVVKAEVKEKIQTLFKAKIEENPAFISLCRGDGGVLWAELGLPYRIREWASNDMVNIIISGIEVVFIINELPGGNYEVDIKIEWTNDKMYDLINSGFGRYVSQSGKEGLGGTEKHSIDWLEWLLDGGSSFSIADYHIEYGDFPGISRSGQALMKPGGSWTLPKFPGAGTYEPDNNFITESLKAAIPEILSVVVGAL